MKKILKRLCTGFLALATVVTALPTTPVHAESKQYWTESKERGFFCLGALLTLGFVYADYKFGKDSGVKERSEEHTSELQSH